MKTKHLLTTLAFCVAIAGSAVAAEKVIPTFKKADVDGNGEVDAAEFKAATAAGVKKTLAELDKDGSGRLSPKEYEVILEEDCD
ncbi:MAG: hypothetical protein ACPGUC_07880 [Gammaproteobacteria bacterium]